MNKIPHFGPNRIKPFMYLEGIEPKARQEIMGAFIDLIAQIQNLEKRIEELERMS